MYYFKWWDFLVALVVVVFTLWVPGTWAKWLVVLAGLFMVYHAFRGSKHSEAPVKKSKTKKKK